MRRKMFKLLILIFISQTSLATNVPVTKKISEAIQLAKQNDFKKSESTLKSIKTKELNTDALQDKYKLANVIIKYHKKDLTQIEKAVDAFAKDCHDPRFLAFALNLQAKAYFENKNYDKAKVTWSSVLNQNLTPRLFDEVMIGIIQAENALGNHEKVLASLRQFLTRNEEKINRDRRNKLYTELAKTAIERAKVLANNNKQTEATLLLKDISKSFPDTDLQGKILLQQAYYFGRTQNWDDAIRKCDEILAQEQLPAEDRANAAYLKARVYEYKLDLKKAAKELIGFAKTYPSHTKAIFAAQQAARFYAGEGHYKNATMSLLYAAQLKKQNVGGEFIAAAEYLVLEKNFTMAKLVGGKIKPDELSLEEATRYDLLMGKLFLQSQDHEDKAIEHLDKVTDATNSNSFAMRRFGAEASLLLADLYSAKLKAIKLSGPLKTVRINFAEKSELYESKIAKYYQRAIDAKVVGFQTQAAQQLAKISLTFQQEIDYAANFISSDTELRSSMKKYSHILSKVSPLFIEDHNKLSINVPANFIQRKSLPKPETDMIQLKDEKPKYKKIEFFQDKSLGSY